LREGAASFFQSHFKTLWDLLWRIGEKSSPTSSISEAPTDDDNTQQVQYMQSAVQAASHLWRMVGSSYFGGYSQSSVIDTSYSSSPPKMAHSASTGFQARESTPAMYSRSSYMPEAQVPLPVTPGRVQETPENVWSGFNSSPPSGSPPPFPVPQLN